MGLRVIVRTATLSDTFAGTSWHESVALVRPTLGAPQGGYGRVGGRPKVDWRQVSRQRESEHSRTGGHDYHLLAFDAERHWVAGHGAAEVDVPEFFAALGVEGEEVTFHRGLFAADPASGASEQHIPRCGQDSGPWFGVHLVFPDSFACFRI